MDRREETEARAAARICTFFAALCAAGCSSPEPSVPAAKEPAEGEAAARATPTDDEASGEAAAQGEPAAAPETTQVVLVTDPSALAAVTQSGGDFAALLGGPELAGAANAGLYRHRRWRSIARVLAGDIARLDRRDPKAGVGVRGNAHRLFDSRWLRADSTRFELVGVASRLDRAPFTAGACGDTRLIYRLAYRTEVGGEEVHSRLPMTALIALRGESREDDPDCRRAAKRWQAPSGLAGERLGRWLVSAEGPLRSEALAPNRVDRVLVNLQSMRWPSAVRPDLGGHAEYILRAFSPGTGDGSELSPAPLLATPASAKLRRDRRLREELLAWIRDPDNLARIDRGTAVLPGRFSARAAVSVSPRGWARRANRPYRQLFSADDFADLDLSGMRYARSAEALLRRLDDQTCQGCHQGRTIAGFHLLGEAPPDAVSGNALAVAQSVHLSDERRRREVLGRRLAAGQEADLSRPFSERAPDSPGAYGSHCGLGDAGFETWTCKEGLECRPYDAPADDAVIGVCLPVEPEVGDPCQVARVRPHADPHRDRARGAREGRCPSGAVCNTNKVGFPGGMCTESCGGLSEEAACGAIALLGPFNSCLARRTPFPRCLAEHVAPAGLRACDAENPCRDDYICSRTSSGEGACIPPYFLFQLRVDGHP